jgi:hypothetical protein
MFCRTNKLRALAILTLICLAGCVRSRPNHIIASKDTVFGLDISSDPQSRYPQIRIGMIRRFFQQVPTSTNKVFAPDYSSHVDGVIRWTSQEVTEDFSTGKASLIQPNITNIIQAPELSQ